LFATVDESWCSFNGSRYYIGRYRSFDFEVTGLLSPSSSGGHYMTRTCLNWSVTLSVLAFAAACGSSGGVGAGQTSLVNVGGKSGNSAGGSFFNVTAGGSGDVAGNGNGDLGGAGGDGSTGDGTSPGGADSNGGAGGGGQDTSVLGSGGSRDIRVTGGTGNSNDVGTGGGSSRDVTTGGAETIDQATGGASSIDVMTGGGSSIDQMTGGGSSVDQGTGGAPPTIDLGCSTASPLNQINVFVTIDASPSGADTEGNMYVGGNLTATGSYTVGAKDTLDCNRYSLVVGGNITIKGGSINGGKAVYGGTTASVSGVSFACDGLQRGKGDVDLVALKATVEALSLRLSAVAANGTVTSTGNKLTLTGTDKKLNVFNITAAQLTAVTETDVNFPAGSAVVVNVSGTDIVWGGGSVCLNGQCGDSTQANSVLWNFYEAATITSSGMAIEGSLLAPFATLTARSGGGHIAGQVIVQYLNGGLEYHPYYFDACLMWTSLV
jgi:choice-of-anchor A domain-containing protein